MTSSAAAGGPCCAWTDFIQPVRERWHPEWGTLDEDHARTAWHRYSATSGEYLNSAQAGKLDEDQDADVCRHGIPRDEFCGECGHAG